MPSFHQAPTRHVSHVFLKVRNLPTMVSFYKDTLGFSIISETPKQVVLGVDQNALLTLDASQNYTLRNSPKAGLYHFAILLPNRNALASFFQYAQARGVIEGASDHGVSEALYFSDPEENGIEVYADKNFLQWPFKDGLLQMVTLPLNVRSLLANPPQPWKGMPSGTILGHIHLHVSDLAKAEKFYHQGLGLKLMQRYGSQAAFLADGGYHHHVGINTWNGIGIPSLPSDMAGLGYFTLRIESKEAREAVIQNLTKLGYVVENQKGMTLTKDPSGNWIQLQVA